MSIAIIATSESIDSYACEVGEALVNEGCEVLINPAYNSKMKERIGHTYEDNILTLSKKDKDRDEVTLYYKPTGSSTTYDRGDFVLNWRYYLQ